MSALKLLKNHKGDKAGAIVTRPFMEARELVANGIAERLNRGGGEKAAVGTAPDQQSKLDAANRRADAAEAEVKRLTAEVAELKELLEAEPKTESKADPKPK